MTTVILAEKPSQALAYAQAFQKTEKKDGYFTVTDSLFPDETTITFGFGHLVELAKPSDYEDKWQKFGENLPIFPQDYQFQVASDKKKQFKIVKDLLQKAETIIVATDSDREGSNIAWSIIKEAKAFSKSKTYKRLWINSLEKEAIRAGFAQLKTGESDFPAYQEAQTRQISDWLIGMNASPLYTLELQKKHVQGTFSIGRVQTPTLYMIYKRQLEIENFQKEPYFEIEGDVQVPNNHFKANLEPSKRFKTQSDLKSHLEENSAQIGSQSAIIQSVKTSKKSTQSPSLFSLSALQKKANSLFKISAKETLKTVQSLYEAKLLTYPRTDTPYITHNEFNYLKENIESYKAFLGIHAPTTQTEPRKRYVNDSKVQEHHAIVLTKQTPTKERFEKLSMIQQKVYLLVAKTTVAMFLDNYDYEETEILTKVGQLLFKSKGQIPYNQGWKVLFESKESTTDKEKEPQLPKVTEGQEVMIDLQSKQKETQPPKPYNEGSIIIAMKTAGKTVDDEEAKELLNEIEGIGTEATRAEIIETLKKREYIHSQKNQLVVTEKGKVLCQAVEGQSLLTSAEMTAKWEGYLKKIGQKQGTQEAFLTNIKKFIIHLLEHVPADIDKLDIQHYEQAKKVEQEQNIVGKCPKCEGNILKKKSFYGCSNYPNCTFTLAGDFRGKKLGKKNIEELLSGKETIVTKVKKKDSKDTYNAKVKTNEKGYIEMVGFTK
ncbi:DNA topoisomerase 3 [Lactococcus lactis]|uniref:DNA topoisomerase 3 n=1 Tax=Lactococcus lactis TaxID=1358 RepID=UPI0025A211C7|nr:DNA topoisomerase 3 [Lactococcus lactis]MDM7644475.1 DNA topoisomerase 3 [Lactococcus lactis]MDN5652358.1 DNA topoisomerase 3 [Lactococcus lactis]